MRVDGTSRNSAWTVMALAMTAPLILAACLTNFDTPGPLTCTLDEDCPADMGCAEEVGLCFERCTESTSCPTLAYRCEGGLCLPVVGAQCAEHGDCVTPAGCETQDNASCFEGQCAYQPVVCDTPPPKECLENDTVIRVYVEVGICTITSAGPIQGQCEYDYTDVPCPGCQANCLEQDPCEGVSCPDENGGCQTLGLCLPTNPPTCQYVDAPVNTICDRAGSAAGAQDGFCDAGLCGAEVPVPCTENTTCSPQTCIAQFCRVVAGFQGICDAGDDADCGTGLECAGEVCLRSAGEPCQNNGECAATCIGLVCASPSGENGPCDPAGDGDDDDCQAALNCNSGVCETGIACSDNGVCTPGDVCISGYCRAPAATGGVCDSGQDGDCVAGNACVAGVCLLLNGQPCSSNSQCENVCIGTVCSAQADTRQPCDTADGAADCQTGHTCTTGLCLLLDGQGSCTDDNQCVNTCIGSTCGPRVGTGSTCDSAGDCLAGHTCTGGACLLNDGQGCTSNSQCLHVCLGGLCGTTSGTQGPCDVADGDADCQVGHDCVGGVCLLDDGQSCTANSQCANICVSLTCGPLVGTGGSCDVADGDADCQVGHDCVGGVCLLDDGQSCTANSQCANTCINLTCAPLSGMGGSCDDSNDCQSSYVCVGQQCSENGIARILVTGAGVSGGGSNLVGWSLVDADGASVGSVSPGTNQSLYEVINWMVDLNTVLTNNDYFALVGDEGSAAVTRTFTFYDALDVQIDQVVVGPVDAGRIVRNFGSSTDAWIRFHFDGNQVTWTQFNKPIARILVTGTATPSGGGSGLSGYFQVNGVGANLGQLSVGTGQNLYQISSWEITLTTPIQEAYEFVLLGNEGSSAITRTFTFKDAVGNTIDTVVISSAASDAIVRIDSWNSGDTYVHFDYNNGVVSSATRTSP